MERIWFARILKAVTAVTANRTTERMEMNVKVIVLFIFLFNQVGDGHYSD